MVERAAFSEVATEDTAVDRLVGAELTVIVASPEPASLMVRPATTLLSVLVVLVTGTPLTLKAALLAVCARVSVVPAEPGA
jgi:hypothetical protein